VGQRTREKRERQKRSRRLKNEKKQAAIRAKYGPKRKPAKVIVKSVETGEVIEIVDQSAFRRGFADSLEEKARAAGFAGYGVLGAERLSSLETLCEDCHRAVHT
jgi:flagellar motor protein MotB